MLRNFWLLILCFLIPFHVSFAQAEPVEGGFYDWSGVYLGAHGGGGRATFDISPGSAVIVPSPGTTLDVTGALFGPVTGINFQDGRFVYGLEGDASFGDFDRRNPTFTLPSVEVQAIGTVRARVGLAFDRLLVFATGGLGIAGVESSERGVSKTSQVHVGVVTGMGAEYALNDNLIGRVDFMTGWFGSERHRYGPPVPTPHSHGIDFSTIIGRASIIWKFGPLPN